MRFILTVLISSLSIAGCGNRHVADDSYIFDIPKGTMINLTNTVVVPAGRTNVLFQNGTIAPYYEIEKYNPYCRFRISGDDSDSREIKPGSFRITQVVQTMRLAQGSDTYNYLVKFELHGDSISKVTGLNCGAWGDTNDFYITVNQMRTALGKYFEIVIP